MAHLMIDLETLDVIPNAVILSIGIVKFDPRKQGIIDRLELKPTIEDQTDLYNRTISEHTIQWWCQQSPEAVAAGLGDEGRISLKECMEKVYQFCWNQEKVWSNGATFDVVMMETAFRQTLTDLPNPVPWYFYNIRDTRTIYEIAKVSLKDKKYGTKTTHNAVEDAEHQVVVLQDAYQKLMAAGFLT